MSNKEKIYFKEDSAPIIFDMLKNNGLEETKEDFLKRLSEKRLLQGEIIIGTAEKIFLKEDTKDNLITFLQTELNTTKKTATKIYNEILEKLIPIADKYTLPDNKNQIVEPMQKTEILKEKIQNEKVKPTINKEDNYREKI